jgi:branched-chain amino acid transport system substrate-binding protein
MAQAFTALHTAYDKAIKANGGNWPTREQVVDATAGTEFATGFGRPITLRPEDNQGLEAQLVGVTKSFPGYDFKLLDNMMIFDPKVITNPAGMRSVEWLKTLKPEFVKMDVPTFKQYAAITVLRFGLGGLAFLKVLHELDSRHPGRPRRDQLRRSGVPGSPSGSA